MQITFANAENEQKTQTKIRIELTLTHSPETTQAQAESLVLSALTDFAKAQHLDIYLRDEKECAIGIDPEKVSVAVEEWFRKQFIGMIAAQRTEDAARAVQASVRQSLLGED